MVGFLEQANEITLYFSICYRRQFSMFREKISLKFIKLIVLIQKVYGIQEPGTLANTYY